MSTPQFSRRAVLRGFGTALALPWLERFIPAASGGARAPGVGANGHPLRLIYVYVPNGVHMPEWTPSAEGRDYELPWILQPLEPMRRQVSVVSGLVHDKGRANGDGPGDHARAAAVFLTGVQPLKRDGLVSLGISADQVAANAVGEATRFRSLELGVDPSGNSGQCDSGYACAYSSNIAWQSATTPADKEVNPRLLFDRIFRGGSGSDATAAEAERMKRRRSVLDFVQEDARRLRAGLSNADRAKLEEYFSGVRELERRIEAASESVVAEVGDDLRPAGTPRDYGEHLTLLRELLVLALRTDRTRVATLMFANEGSDRAYRNLGISDGHHSISHHGNDEAKQESIRKINRFHIEHLAALLQALEASEEGSGNLLDHSMLVFGSGISDGNRHNHDELPVLVCGRGGGLTPGSHLRAPKGTPMMNLHLELLERMGAGVASLGDSTGRFNPGQ
ncbi:MAG: DUF1552 domain-containing protein [Planctomycetota bacterium]|nr:DUF1552 domain-containing protein [Planctomycetota bacterium]